MTWGVMKWNRGFTLTELMVSLVISGVLMTAVYAVFNSQEKSYAVQEQLAAAHQNLRAAMNLMVSEIRMAGYDPKKVGDFGIMDNSNSSLIEFKMDLSGDGDTTSDPNEWVTYEIRTGSDGIKKLARTTGDPANPHNTYKTVAENIEALTFVYLDDSGEEITDLSDRKSDIRSVRITLVASTAKPDPAYKQNGGFRTKTLTEQVICRNLAF
jgi:type IV pilus assembly protein PilW